MFAAQRYARAWMEIGSAVRLEQLQRFALSSTSSTSWTTDQSRRCYWTIFVLERLFFPQYPYQTLANDDLFFPPSIAVPPPPSTRADEVSTSLAENRDSMPPEDIGVVAYMLKKISTWGKIAAYLHTICTGEVEVPWTADSKYNALVAEIYDNEFKVVETHLLRHVQFPQRTQEEILNYDQYWMPWVTWQMISHAAPAILNHPFIHLVSLRTNSTARMFLQQAMDQALFHSGWIFRLMTMCSDLQLQLNDPLIGHLIAAVATIPWLLQFSKKGTVSEKASQNLKMCMDFLETMAMTWPHLQEKV